MASGYDDIREGRRKKHGKPFTITVNTWIPEKYLLVDRETGDVWRYIVDGDEVHTRRVEMFSR